MSAILSGHGAARPLGLHPSLEEGLQHARILIIDDQLENLTLLRRVLSKAGYAAMQSTTDPNEAATLFEAFCPDLVLLDLHMPGLDGFAVLERLRSLTPRATYLPILVLTGDHDPLKRRRALAAGATDFLAKPFDNVEIVLRIRNLLETRHLHRLLSNQNSVLEAGVRQRTRELEEAQGEILERLAAAAEYRDDDTGRHTLRVGELSAAIAEALGLARETAELIRAAAPLHDVGKIGVPDHILLKPGNLTPEEFDVMKTHTTIGAAILAGGKSALVMEAERIALNHHERWDGSGYPNGRRGDAIPLSARVVAVADVFDALTHPRPYRLAWPLDRVIAEIRAQSGQHFDPSVVAAFLRHSARTGLCD
ncbi:MAG: HD domain-containing phosphohydrolase [Gemmatimonadaceae bacterium]